LILTLLEVFDAAPILDEGTSLDGPSFSLAASRLGPPVLFESAFCYVVLKSFSVCWPTSDLYVYSLPRIDVSFSSAFNVFLDNDVLS